MYIGISDMLMPFIRKLQLGTVCSVILTHLSGIQRSRSRRLFSTTKSIFILFFLIYLSVHTLNVWLVEVTLLMINSPGSSNEQILSTLLAMVMLDAAKAFRKFAKQLLARSPDMPYVTSNFTLKDGISYSGEKNQQNIKTVINACFVVCSNLYTHKMKDEDVDGS